MCPAIKDHCPGLSSPGHIFVVLGREAPGEREVHSSSRWGWGGVGGVAPGCLSRGWGLGVSLLKYVVPTE